MVATSSFIIAASSLFSLSFGAPLLRSDARTARSLVERTAYRVFGGDGSTAAGWPAESDWLSFEDLWTANLPIITSSCTQYAGSPQNNNDEETALVKKALESTAETSGVKKEFLLAVMMQESKGCVRAPTTNYGVRNPGLFQDHDGKGTCNDPNPITPCPEDQINLMIQEGAGVGNEFGLKQTIDLSQATDVSKYYKGARIYNSGSVDPSGNLGAGIATHCYASDVANRLLGWTSEASGCEEGTIGSVTGSTGGGNDQGETTTPTTENPPATTTTPPTTGGDSTPSGPKAEGAAANCTKWYTVKSGDNCGSTGVALETLRSLNTGLSADCSNLWLGSSYCIAA